MSFIYSKEILDGVSSRRKFFGIPIYIRNDILGVITRKYFLGIWKTVTYPEGKRYYLFGIKVKNKGKTYDLPKNITSTYNVQNTSKVSADNLNSNKPKPKISDNIINSVSTTPELQGLYKQITDLTSTVNLLKDKLIYVIMKQQISRIWYNASIYIKRFSDHTEMRLKAGMWCLLLQDLPLNIIVQ